MGLKTVTGSRYLEGFIEEGEAEKSWLAGKAVGWVESVETLVGISSKQPYSAYAGLQKSLQQKWSFVQQVTPGFEVLKRYGKNRHTKDRH